MIIPALQIILGREPQQFVDKDATGPLVQIQNFFYQSMSDLADAHGQSGALLFVSGWVIITFFLKNLTRYLALYSVAPLRNGVIRDIRNAMHQKVLRLPLHFFQDRRKGDLMSRMTGDLKEVEWAVMHFIEVVFREPLMIIGSLSVLFYMSTRLTIFVFIALPIVSLIITWIGKSLKRSSGQAQERLGQLLSIAEESIYGLRVLKAFNAEKQHHRQFARVNEDHYRVMNRVLRKNDLASPMSEVLGTTLMALIIWRGGNEVIQSDHFNAEQFIAYIAFFYQMIAPAKSLSRANAVVQRGRAAGERIFEILDARNSILETEGDKTIDTINKGVRFENVHFSYEEKEVIHGVSFEIPKGKTIALVGQSGSGKSTLASLLPRFYDVDQGSIYLDDFTLKELTTDSLRSIMGVVTQDSILFHGSVRDNIALGKQDASLDEIQAAAKVANAHDFIMELPGGYDSNIGDTGGKLSGGQRQRLSIARAVLKNPDILILDEATSALDTESEKLVQEALTRLMRSRTSLVIAHRLSTIQFADEILVMDDGNIVERGTHQSLLDQNGVYAKLCEMQSFA